MQIFHGDHADNDLCFAGSDTSLRMERNVDRIINQRDRPLLVAIERDLFRQQFRSHMGLSTVQQVRGNLLDSHLRDYRRDRPAQRSDCAQI